MRKAIANTKMVSVLACTTVFMLSACTLLQSNESRSLYTAGQDAPVYRGKIITHRVDGESHYSMGCVFQERKKHRLAITEFEIVVQHDPGHVAAYNGLGVSLDALGDFDRAVAAYKAALAIDQNLDYVLNNLGYSYLLQGRPDLAIGYFEKAVALDGNNQRYQNNLGLAYARAGEYDAALAAFIAGGDEAKAHSTMGLFYYRNGLYEEAGVHFSWASVIKPTDADNAKSRKAAASLSQIYANTKTPPEKKEMIPAQKTEKEMARYDNDGFYTIPAGAIEDLEILETDKTEIAQNSYDSSPEDDDQPIYTVSLSRIASPEETRETTRKILEAERLEIMDEGQALEVLSLKDTNTGMPSKTRILIEVSNGNGVRHMARRVGNYLSGKGFILMYLSNANHFNHDGTSIYYTREYLGEAYRLSQELPGLQRLQEVQEIRNGNAEISVLIGSDLKEHLSLFEQR